MSEIHRCYFIMEFLFSKDIRVTALTSGLLQYSHISLMLIQQTKKEAVASLALLLSGFANTSSFTHVPARICKVLCSAFCCFQDKAETTEKGGGAVNSIGLEDTKVCFCFI